MRYVPRGIPRDDFQRTKSRRSWKAGRVLARATALLQTFTRDFNRDLAL